MNNNLLKVGIYLRLSNEDKDKVNDNSESIKNQRNMLIQYVNNHNEFIIVDEYCDEDLSGAGTYRPEFERLIRDCEKRKLDVVLCKSQSRFSRDMEIVEKYINNKFKEWNIRFISLSDNADTIVLGNKKSRQINGLVNEWYLEDVSNNIRSAFTSKMKQGEFISPFAPYGYDVSKSNNNKLVIDPFACLIVKKIYNLYLKGFGFNKITNYLNSKNIPCPSLYKYQKGIKLNIVSNKPIEEIKWNSFSIKSILKNEVYLGHLVQGKRTTISYKNHKIIKKDKNEWIKVKNTHEAIIDESTFNKVQTAIIERTKPIKKNNMVHIFSGKVFCYDCNHIMRKKNSTTHEYLICENNCDNNKSIRYDKLANLVLNSINEIINHYFDSSLLKNIYIENNNELLKEKILIKKINEIKIKKSKLQYYIKCIYEDKINGIITIEQFNNLLSSYNCDNVKYDEEIKLINNKLTQLKNKKDFSIKYNKFSSLNRIIIEEFIDKIYISKENKLKNERDIRIYYKL